MSLSHIPSYFLSLVRPFSFIVSTFVRIFCGFNFQVERKRDHLVWNLVCEEKEDDGIILGRLGERNKAMLGKWL